MLHNFVFQDNIYQVARLIDITKDGLYLELAPELFLKKSFDDIIFIDKSLDALYKRVEHQMHLNDYRSIMHCLYSAENKFVRLINDFQEKSPVERLNIADISAHLYAISEKHRTRSKVVGDAISATTPESEAAQFVSQNELSALFNL